MNRIRHVIGQKITGALYRGRHRGTAYTLRTQAERLQLAEIAHVMPELKSREFADVAG